MLYRRLDHTVLHRWWLDKKLPCVTKMTSEHNLAFVLHLIVARSKLREMSGVEDALQHMSYNRPRRNRKPQVRGQQH